MNDNYDIIIAGARCAGAATAMLLARNGLRVLLIDPRRPKADTLSTHALMRPALYLLKEWGLLDRVIASNAAPVSSTLLVYGDDAVRIPVTDRSGVGTLYSPRRNVLDEILVDAAVEAGVDVRFGWKLEDVLRHGEQVKGAIVRDAAGARHRFSSLFVIGADGRSSTVAQLVGAPFERVSEHYTRCMYAYFAGVPNDGYRWFYQPGRAAGVVPTNDGESCVFVCLPSAMPPVAAEDREALFQSELELMSPGLLDHTERRSPLRSFAGANGFLRRPRGPGWALVGDAGYFKDPLTAHGITDAFRDAEILCAAIVAGERDLATYQCLRDQLSRRFFTLTDAVASFQWDLDTLQQMHVALNDEMKNELQLLELARVIGRTSPIERSIIACA